MGVFDNLYGQWIQVVDDKNSVTIEDFDYSTGVIGPITEKHCAKCVAVNQCWFKNEKGKKPERFTVDESQLLINIAKGLMPGLYHYRCHCKEYSIFTPNKNDVQLIVDDGKVKWLFSDKGEWIKAMGYEDDQQFLKVLFSLIKQAYCNGDYLIIEHNKYGAKINLLLSIGGVGIKAGHNYKVKSAFMIFPNGKLKCNTLLGGRR